MSRSPDSYSVKTAGSFKNGLTAEKIPLNSSGPPACFLVKASPIPAASGGRLVLVIFAYPDGDGSRFRADIETDAAPGATGTAIGNRVVALTIQGFTLHQNTGRTRLDTKRAPLAQMNGDLNVATIRVAHASLLNADFRTTSNKHLNVIRFSGRGKICFEK
jgi:hypothetical protein